MQKREFYVPKVYTFRKNYFTHFHMQLVSCGNTSFVGCLKCLSLYYSCDCHRVGRLLWQQRQGARRQLPASCTWHWDLCTEKLCTGRETTWEEVEGRRRSRVFHIDCTRLNGSVYRGEDNDSEIQSWKNTWIQLRTRHSMKTRFISLVFSFFFSR